MLITQGGPQDAGGPASGGHASHQVRFGQFEFGVSGTVVKGFIRKFRAVYAKTGDNGYA